jgi:hypothetical protein
MRGTPYEPAIARLSVVVHYIDRSAPSLKQCNPLSAETNGKFGFTAMRTALNPNPLGFASPLIWTLILHLSSPDHIRA